MFMLPPCGPPSPPRPWERTGYRRTWIYYFGSEQFLALGRREDAEHLAVFGHGAPSDLDSLLFFEHLDDGLVAEGVGFVLLIDDFFDGLLHAFGGDVLVCYPSYRRIEEILELEQALRRVHVFVRRDAGNRRLVHAHRLGHVP